MTFQDKFRKLIREADLSSCEIFELSLRELGQIAIEEAESIEIGIAHLSEHANNAIHSLVSNTKRPTLH